MQGWSNNYFPKLFNVLDFYPNKYLLLFVIVQAKFQKFSVFYTTSVKQSVPVFGEQNDHTVDLLSVIAFKLHQSTLKMIDVFMNFK